jgi:signal transduction histidine kinase
MNRTRRAPSSATFVAGQLAFVLVYWLAAQLGFTLAFSVRQVSPVWPPTGIALAVLLLFGRRWWPGLAAGAFLANVSSAEPTLTALGVALGNTLEAVAGAALLERLGFDRRLGRVRDVMALLGAALSATTISATVGVTALAWSGLVPAEERVSTWVVWWVGDVMGALVVTPLLLTPATARLRRERLPETALLFALLIAVGIGVFVSPPTAEGIAPPLEYLVFPLVIWAAIRCGRREVALAVALVSVFAIVGAVHDRGPFAHGGLTARLVFLQLFMGVVTMTGLTLSAVVAERGRSEEERAALLRKERAAREGSEAAYELVRRANTTKDDFLAVLSHELRTPLTPILGWTRLLRDEVLDEPTRQRALEVIERNARLQVRLVEELLDASRIVAGKMKLERQRVDLGVVAASAFDMVQEAAAAKPLDLHVHLPETPAFVWGDAERLQQVVANLLSNAVKFTPPRGRVELAVETGPGEAIVRVRDDGEGIESAFLPQIFAPFTQWDTGTRRAHGGLGLGLSIVRHIVDRHGGSVHAESDGKGRGTTMTVRLPSTGATLVPAAAEGPIAAPMPRLDAVRILLVEDDGDARELIREVLRGAGAEVRTAEGVDEALAALVSWPAEVLVSDLAMPGRDGLDLIRSVRAAGAACEGLVAVLLTAYAGDEERRQSSEAGYDAHVAKPVHPVELVEAIVACRRRL